MATYNKFYPYVADLHNGEHDLGSDQLVVALTNTLPIATNAVLAEITEVAYTYCSTRNITTISSTQAAGIYKLLLTDLVLSASGGAVGPFRYAVIYNDTPTSPANPLICWADYGSSITLSAGESITLDFHATNGLFSAT